MSEKNMETITVRRETGTMLRILQAAFFCWIVVYGWKIADAGSHGLDMLFHDITNAVQVCQNCWQAITQ